MNNSTQYVSIIQALGYKIRSILAIGVQLCIYTLIEHSPVSDCQLIILSRYIIGISIEQEIYNCVMPLVISCTIVHSSPTYNKVLGSNVHQFFNYVNACAILLNYGIAICIALLSVSSSTASHGTIFSPSHSLSTVKE